MVHLFIEMSELEDRHNWPLQLILKDNVWKLTRGSRKGSINSLSRGTSNLAGVACISLSEVRILLRASWIPLCCSISLEKSSFWLRKGKTMASEKWWFSIKYVAQWSSVEWPSMSWCPSTERAHARQYPKKFWRSFVGGLSRLRRMISNPLLKVSWAMFVSRIVSNHYNGVEASLPCIMFHWRISYVPSGVCFFSGMTAIQRWRLVNWGNIQPLPQGF